MSRALATPRPRRALAVSAVVAAALAAALAPAPARAIQPLAEFLASARRHNHDNREAAVAVRQREHQVDQAKWDFTPTVNVTAAYTRNQYEVKVTLPGADPANPLTRTITPYNQLDAQLTLTQPILDVAVLRNIEIAKANLESQQARVAATRLQVEQSVAQAYFQVVAAEAFIRATHEVHQAARASLEIVQQRAAAGMASGLARPRGGGAGVRGDSSLAHRRPHRPPAARRPRPPPPAGPPPPPRAGASSRPSAATRASPTPSSTSRSRASASSASRAPRPSPASSSSRSR